jgi:2,3-bisphosphoglycerate-independent phosphoglycerate mutase
MTDVAAQLDAMLLGWLEHNADRRGPARPDLRATAVMTIAAGALPEIQHLCERWNMTVVMQGAVALISGPARVVDGLVAVTGMYRR